MYAKTGLGIRSKAHFGRGIRSVRDMPDQATARNGWDRKVAIVRK
jgi:hypothetical protein